MRTASRLKRAVLLPVLGVLAAACGRDAGPADEPERVALSLFELAQGVRPDEARLTELIEQAGGDRRRASLYDSLERLREAGRPEVVGVDRLDPLGRVVVEVRCRLEGDAEAYYTVQLEPASGGGRLRITAFDGPGVSWPPRRGPHEMGLSSWPEP